MNTCYNSITGIWLSQWTNLIFIYDKKKFVRRMSSCLLSIHCLPHSISSLLPLHLNCLDKSQQRIVSRDIKVRKGKLLLHGLRYLSLILVLVTCSYRWNNNEGLNTSRGSKMSEKIYQFWVQYNHDRHWAASLFLGFDR